MQIRLSPVVQCSALAAVIAATAALGYLGINQIGYVRLVGDQKLAVARGERANIDLQDDIANLRDRLAITARDRRGSGIGSGEPGGHASGSARIDRDETPRVRAENFEARDDAAIRAGYRSQTGRTSAVRI